MSFLASLNARTLSHHAARISVPRYDRAALQPGVVHIGVGAFHRSHQAMFFDELARLGLGNSWAVTGVGLHHRRMKEALRHQDWLYTAVPSAPHGADARVVGVMTRYLFAPDDDEAVVKAMADERIRLVTLTITGRGYHVDVPTAAPRWGRPGAPLHEQFCRSPPSALGLLVEALDRRRRQRRRPFTILSCDNLADNGRRTKESVLSVATARDPRLADWIDRHPSCPDSLVDRIPPAASDAERDMVERRFGVRDRSPVITERFSQWVVEDRFCSGRPPLEEVGVRFVDDARPYAVTKTRLLNASHSALGYLGSLLGYQRVDEAIADPVLHAYIERMMSEEIIPLLPPTNLNLQRYGRLLRDRMANPAGADRLSRLCRNGSSKVPNPLLSSIHEARAAGRPHQLLTLAVSAWCRYLRRVDEQGRRLPLEDPRAEHLERLAARGGDDPRELLSD